MRISQAGHSSSRARVTSKSGVELILLLSELQPLCVYRKKKKKKSHSLSEHAKLAEKERVREKSDEILEQSTSARDGGGPGKRQLTEAERRFEETQRRRVSTLFVSQQRTRQS